MSAASSGNPMVSRGETAASSAGSTPSPAAKPASPPAAIWIAATSARAGSLEPETRVLGLPLLERVVLSAARAGYGRIFVGQTAGRDLSPFLGGTPARVVGPADAVPRLDAGRIAIVSAASVPTIPELVRLRDAPASSERAIGSGGSALLLETDDPGRLAGLLARAASAEDLAGAVRRVFPEAQSVAGADGGPASRPEDLRSAERRLLASLIKENEGFMSRHVERPISLALSRRLTSTRVTPNAMTLVSLAVGLAGASFFLSNRAALQLTGALLFLLHSILDGCDGELARLKFSESRFGGLLDFWGDNVVHSAVFGAVAIAWSRGIGEHWPLALGVAAIAGTLLSAALVYLETMRVRNDGPVFASVSRKIDSRISRVADALARRDFTYLVVILSAFGKARWFLVLAAVGAPLFFLTLAALAASNRESPGSRRTFS